MKKFLFKNRYILLILVLGVFFRFYHAKDFFLYSHDQDLAGWMIRDILGGHFRLIGQETSSPGVFIGPLFYYSLIPFYLIYNMDPFGGVIWVTLIGLATIYSYYFVFSKIRDRKTGLVAAFIYAGSFATALTDREVVPTTPVMLWSIWFFYTVYLLYKGKQKTGFLLLGILAGLIWNFNLGLILTIPVALIAFLVSRKRIEIFSLVRGVAVGLVLSVPLILFEVRHNFQQTKAVLGSLAGGGSEFHGGLAKLDWVFNLASKNVNRLFGTEVIHLEPHAAFYLMAMVLLFLIYKKVIKKSFGVLLIIWIASVVAFFSLNSIVISEYYLNSMNVVWIAVFVFFASYLLSKERLFRWGSLLLAFFLFINWYELGTYQVNASGYIERKAIVSFIKSDAAKHGYPCISISYITKPGYELGYRYLFFREDMHVNNPNSGSPPYTIVFPLSLVDRVDKSFGALGLVYPDYARYNKKSVEDSCQGGNSNLTDPLFGYTE